MPCSEQKMLFPMYIFERLDLGKKSRFWMNTI